jgi:hypothetical protein
MEQFVKGRAGASFVQAEITGTVLMIKAMVRINIRFITALKYKKVTLLNLIFINPR